MLVYSFPTTYPRPRLNTTSWLRRILRCRRREFGASLDVLMEAAGFVLLLAAFLLPLYLLG